MFVKNRLYFKLLFIFYAFVNTLGLDYFGIGSDPLGVVIILYGLILIIYGVVYMVYCLLLQHY